MKSLSRTLILSLSAAALVGCTSIDGSPDRTATGALVGTGVGAIAGRVIGGGSTTGTVVGGAIGSIAGAAIGATLDRQQNELQQGLAGSGATVVNTGNQLVVTLPESITFDVDSATVQPEYVDEIQFIARSLNNNPNSTIQVIGHTDNTGSAAHNQRLSERRAAAVAAILTSDGVAPARIHTVGRGMDQPIASNDTPGGRAQNRRVEIIITPTDAA